MFHRNPFDDHTDAVDTLAAAGVDIPPEWIDIRNRFVDFTYLQSPTLALLANAVIDGDNATLPALRAQALAEATALPPAEAEVTNSVQAAVLARLRHIYAPHAVPNYRLIADGFTKTASKLAAAMKVVDPDTEPSEVINADAKTRTAWTEAQQYALQLTSRVPSLRAAANLAGIRAYTDDVLLPLTADVSGLHRRRVWEAWDTTEGRTGRWGALIRLGATLRAADLNTLEAYRKPKPMEVRQQHNGIGVRHVSFDPEDAELAEATSG